MIVLGGTFDVYHKPYKIKFIKALYDACNTFPEYLKTIDISDTQKYVHAKKKNSKAIRYPSALATTLEANKKAKQRIIGLTIETRPEYVTDENCLFRRSLGITRIEMGIQSCDDTVLKMNRRGHTLQQARNACHKLRQYGFKFALHIMPGLYGSTAQKDIQTFNALYCDPYLKPDEIKFYPTSVIPHTKLAELYTQ